MKATEVELPWQIVNGMIVSGSFETEREELLADAVNRSVSEALERTSWAAYRRGVEDGKALYAPRNWLARLLG